MFYLDPQIFFAFILPFLLLLHPLRRKVREGLPTRVNSTGDSAVPISWHSLGWFFGHSLPPLMFINLSSLQRALHSHSLMVTILRLK